MLVPVWSLRQEDCLSSGGGDQFGLHLSEEDHYNISSVIECVLSTVSLVFTPQGVGLGGKITGCHVKNDLESRRENNYEDKEETVVVCR